MQEKDNQSNRWEFAISLSVITLVTIVAYGFMLPKLGFYRDDWYMIWSAQAQGTQGVIDLFKIDRPFIGILYALFPKTIFIALVSPQSFANVDVP